MGCGVSSVCGARVDGTASGTATRVTLWVEAGGKESSEVPQGCVNLFGSRLLT